MNAAERGIARDAVATVELLYALEQRQELDAWAELWSEDAVVTFPFATDPAAARIVGKTAIVESTARKFATRDRVELDVQIDPLADPRRVLVHLDAHIHFSTAERLRLPLLCVFTMDSGGRIARLEEYLNEAILTSQVDPTTARGHTVAQQPREAGR